MKAKNKNSTSNKPSLEKLKVTKLENTIAIKGGRCGKTICNTDPH